MSWPGQVRIPIGGKDNQILWHLQEKHLGLLIILTINVVNGHQLAIGSGKAVCATVDDMEVIGVNPSNGRPFGQTFKFARKIVQF